IDRLDIVTDRHQPSTRERARTRVNLKCTTDPTGTSSSAPCPAPAVLRVRESSDVSVEQLIGAAVLYVSSNVAPAFHAAFSEWCDTIHHFDTMRIEGFLSLRRFELVEGSADGDAPEFGVLTLYQVASANDADFDTPSYARH